MLRFAALLMTLLCSLPGWAASAACAPFRWVTDFDGIERAAMIITAGVNGRSVDLQFDTGADVSGLYGAQVARRLGLTVQELPSGYQGAAAPLSIGDIALGQQSFYLFGQPPGRVAGRLGLEALLGKIVQIDYPEQRICLLNDRQFETLLPELLLTPARVRSNKLFLYTELDGDHWPGLFFDSGASLYDVLVDRLVWQRLTGRIGYEPDNRYIQGWSRNQLITTVGAPLQGSLSLAGFQFSAPLVHFTRERPRHFAAYPVKAQGLIGNAPFFERVIVLDLRDGGTWFGVLKK